MFVVFLKFSVKGKIIRGSCCKTLLGKNEAIKNLSHKYIKILKGVNIKKTFPNKVLLNKFLYMSLFFNMCNAVQCLVFA